jgi:CO dehydrogenase maturation factor
MKIAFVGKWWSGKSTLCALFTSYVLQANAWSALLIDADTNMHSWVYFWVSSYDDQKFLSKEENTKAIKQSLINKNQKIASVNHMVKTTPPGRWSYIIKHTHDTLLHAYNQSVQDNLMLLAVGWYSSEQAWTACYHTSLSIMENILSHMHLRDEDFCVVDMVASTDAFSNSLHIQFDTIVLIVEPTRESTTLVNNYLELAQETWVDQKILILGNKIEWLDDVIYIEQEIDQKLGAWYHYDKDLKTYMRESDSIDWYVQGKMNVIGQLFSEVFTKKPLERTPQLQKLAELHRKYAQQSYITHELWDLSGQIDAVFIQWAQ